MKKTRSLRRTKSLACAMTLFLWCAPSPAAAQEDAAVRVELLDGAPVTGTLAEITADEVILEVDGARQPISRENVQLLANTAAVEESTASADIPVRVRLRDESVVVAQGVVANATTVQLETEFADRLAVPRSAVHAIRFAEVSSDIEESWNQLLQRTATDDLLVVRRGDVLDFLGGVLTTLQEGKVTLLVGERSVPVPQERVFGVILSGTSSTATNAATQTWQLTSGSRVNVANTTYADGHFRGRFQGQSLEVPLDRVARVDFAAGRVVSLASLAPRLARYDESAPGYHPLVWQYRVNANSAGEPLTLGGRTYDQGLWLHSGTTLTYALNREYRSFTALAGIDELATPGREVKLTAIADGRQIFQKVVQPEADPIELNFDVTGVRELTIEAASTREADQPRTREHLALVNARFLK